MTSTFSHHFHSTGETVVVPARSAPVQTRRDRHTENRIDGELVASPIEAAV